MRVTVDLDSPSQLKLLKVYYNLRRFGDVEIRRSAGGQGYHLLVYNLSITYDDSLKIRAMLGECETRLKFDSEKNLKMKQILWRAKVIDGKRYEARTIDERDLLVLPWFSRVPRGVFVRRGG